MAACLAESRRQRRSRIRWPDAGDQRATFTSVSIIQSILGWTARRTSSACKPTGLPRSWSSAGRRVGQRRGPSAVDRLVTVVERVPKLVWVIGDNAMSSIRTVPLGLVDSAAIRFLVDRPLASPTETPASSPSAEEPPHSPRLRHPRQPAPNSTTPKPTATPRSAGQSHSNEVRDEEQPGSLGVPSATPRRHRPSTHRSFHLWRRPDFGSSRHIGTGRAGIAGGLRSSGLRRELAWAHRRPVNLDAGYRLAGLTQPTWAARRRPGVVVDDNYGFTVSSVRRAG